MSCQRNSIFQVTSCILWLVGAGQLAAQEPVPDGAGVVQMTGELMQWHKVTCELQGPGLHETTGEINPFTDCRFMVTFRHESGSPEYRVPGYFAADGQAANTSATSGNIWRAHLSPDHPGRWTYTITFETGPGAALDSAAAAEPTKYHGLTGEFMIVASDKSAPDFRALGRLNYIGKRYLQFAGSGDYFLKMGPDAPETLLGYVDFDDTTAGKRAVPLKTWEPHRQDWRTGDPIWQNGKGQGLIGALNYLSSKGCNSISFLPYNAGGDGDNVWPFVSRDDQLHYDCSKLDQWQIVFDHAQAQGLFLHFKLQEQENDDNRIGHNAQRGEQSTALNGGQLGRERQLYLKELVARFGYELALNWNLGEENTQSAEEQRAMAQYLSEIDPYHHLIVVHTFPDQQEQVYPNLIGNQSVLTGASLQNSWSVAHERTGRWVTAAEAAGRPWVVCNDEQNPASDGVPPDPGYAGHNGVAMQAGKPYTLDEIRKYCLWGTLMAGGGGVEYYFGYKLPQNDLICEDFRSRDQSWDYGRIALKFFQAQKIPFWEMQCADDLIGNPTHDNTAYCLAKAGELYLVYLPVGGTATLDLSTAPGIFDLNWFNPRTGEIPPTLETTILTGGQPVSIGSAPDAQDWLAIIRRR